MMLKLYIYIYIYYSEYVAPTPPLNLFKKIYIVEAL